MKLTKQQKIGMLKAVECGEIASPTEFAKLLGLSQSTEPIVLTRIDADGWAAISVDEIGNFLRGYLTNDIKLPKKELQAIGQYITEFAEGITEDRRVYKNGTPSERGEL